MIDLIYRSFCDSPEEAPRLYRSPSEIAADIRAIRAEMREINERVNVRAVLLDLLSSREKTAEDYAEELRLAVSENEENLALLRELEARLELLRAELTDTVRSLSDYAFGV